MIKLPDGELRDYLPSTMKNDVDMVCLSYAIKKATERLLEYQKSAMTYNIVDNLPEQVLDILAVEMRSIYYVDSMEIETKRQIIKNTLRWYAKAGTLGAIKELTTTTFGAGEISEWFEYGGRPFCFRPIIGIEASQQEVNVFLKYLKVVKNTRSWLDTIIYAVIIDHRNLESIILQNILFKIQMPFWVAHLLDGSKFLDGTKLVNSRKKYNLILGIKNGIKFCIKESIDTACLNIGIKVHTEEKTGVVVAVKAAVNFLHGCHQITDSTGTVTKTKHIAAVKTSETIENITITYRRNLHYVDGSKRVDGSRLLNAFYGKESI